MWERRSLGDGEADYTRLWGVAAEGAQWHLGVGIKMNAQGRRGGRYDRHGALLREWAIRGAARTRLKRIGEVWL